ncbi:MAG: class I SAM-dependent rRNA methyltransferase [Candidatus Obscuribacterales bacterium]|nr:class I SAM-dependent rRNA methyltransferase [Candidatus Obscuribacterales bacterium]
MQTELPKISVKKGREWHVKRGHPWLFSGAISQIPKNLSEGSLVKLLDCDGKFVASGYFNPNCDIAVRVLSRQEGEPIDKAFLAKRIRSAFKLRQSALDFEESNVFRLINAEGDFLPGFIVDYYAGQLVIQCHTAGAENLLAEFVEAIDAELQANSIILRNDSSSRLREGLKREEARYLKKGENKEILVKENGYSFTVDPIQGQKTGFFTDQRDKRRSLGQYARQLQGNSRLLNCFSYTCSFSVYAAAVNSSLRTVNVDQSAAALELGKRNFALNQIDSANHDFHCTDAFAFLEKQLANKEKYEIVILDPPAFAKSNKDKSKALKAYSRLASLGIAACASQGLLLLCSCSGAISLDEFCECIRQSAGNSNRSIQILETFQHGVDHPINLMAPESAYLKVLFCRVI